MGEPGEDCKKCTNRMLRFGKNKGIIASVFDRDKGGTDYVRSNSERQTGSGNSDHGSLTVEYKKKCLQALWYLLFLRQIICFIL